MGCWSWMSEVHRGGCGNVSQVAPTTFFWSSLQEDIITTVTILSHPTGFGDGWSPYPPFPTCPRQPEISCGKLTLRPARCSNLCMQLPPQTELKPHEKHPAGKNKSLTWKRFHCQQEPQGLWGWRVTGVRSRPMLVGRDTFSHPRLGVSAHPAASALVVSTNMCSHLFWEEKHHYWHWVETGFHGKSPQLLLRGKAMTPRGNFPVFISYIVSCFAVEFHGKKEECVFSFYHHFFLIFF